MNRLGLPTILFAALAVSGAADDWPQFRGPNRDAISAETGLLRAWPEGGPRVVWSLGPLEQGYSGAAIVGGRVYFHDYDSGSSEWLVRAVTLEAGAELWTFREKRRIRPNHGITRTVPAVDGRYVFSLDPKATFHALDARSGEQLWRKDLVAEYGTRIPPWYNGQCPLLGDDRVLIAPGGTALVVALDKATGIEIWRTPNPEGWPMSHASLMPAKLGGVDQLLYTTLFGAHGVAADDGRQLWHYPFKFNVSASPSPLAIDSERVYVTAGYDSGGAMLRVRNGDGAFTAETAFVHPPDEWSSEVQTPIFHRGHLFGVGKKKRGLFTCLDAGGKEVWTSEGRASFDLGSFILADGMFFILEGRTGMLRLVEASTTGYRELASAQVLGGHDVWAPLALSDGKLVIRDLERMVCLEVGTGG